MLDECDEYVCKTASGNHQGEEIRPRCLPCSESDGQIFTIREKWSYHLSKNSIVAATSSSAHRHTSGQTSSILSISPI
jgi:hypothetical protein